MMGCSILRAYRIVVPERECVPVTRVRQSSQDCVCARTPLCIRVKFVPTQLFANRVMHISALTIVEIGDCGYAEEGGACTHETSSDDTCDGNASYPDEGRGMETADGDCSRHDASK
jgi:hypothetical protein